MMVLTLTPFHDLQLVLNNDIPRYEPMKNDIVQFNVPWLGIASGKMRNAI